MCSFYGTTEAGGCSSFAAEYIDEYEDGIIGVPLHGVEMKIVDSEGTTCPVGTKGEIRTRTTWRFGGYRCMPEMSAEVLDTDGWFHTNDVGHMREDGNFVLDGRMKEFISSGSIKFFPWTVEKVLKMLPKALHVIAVGVPDARMGQVVCACVVPREGQVIREDDVRDFCDEHFTDSSEVNVMSIKPKYHLVFENLPVTVTGKVDRIKISDIAKSQLGLS